MLNDPKTLATETSQPTNLQSKIQAELLDYSPKDSVKEELKKLRNEMDQIQQRVMQIENNLGAMVGDYEVPVEARSIEKANLLIGPVSKKRTQSAPTDVGQVSDDAQDPAQDLNPLIESKAEKFDLDESKINEFFGTNYSGNHPSYLADQTPTMEDADSEVSSLKRQLEEKLRKAEVEMSIQRARVFQQKAELEEMKHQLDLREQAIQETMKSQAKHGDTVSRWNRQFDKFRKK